MILKTIYCFKTKSTYQFAAVMAQSAYHYVVLGSNPRSQHLHHFNLYS